MDRGTWSTSARRRGHQHHPRHATTRPRLDCSSGPAQCGPALVTNVESQLVSNAVLSLDEPHQPSLTKDNNLAKRPHTNSPLDKTLDVVRPAQCGPDVNKQEQTRDRNSPRRSRRKVKRQVSDDDPASSEPKHAVARARGDGNSDDESTEEDPEIAELAKLRCTSERTEVVAEREVRRRKRCADYPGLAFGFSIFSSDTMMKFNLIKNELQNIKSNQLKRVSIRGICKVQF